MLLIGARAQAVHAPVIHTREEYNNIPIGGKYWYNNRLETKTENTSSLDPPRAELVATPTVYKNAPWLNSTPALTPAPIVEPTPTPRVTPAPPPLGSSANFPIQVNSREEYDKLPAGTWMRDSAGNVVQKAPTVLTQKDLDAIPRGGKYWYQGRLLTKWGGTPAKDTAQATPTPSTIQTEEESKAYFSATPVPTPPVVVTRQDRQAEEWERQLRGGGSVVVTQDDYDSIHDGALYWLNGKLWIKQPVSPNKGILLLQGVTAVIAFVLVVVAVIGLVIYAYRLKPKPKSADPGTKRTGQIYSDQAQFQLAMRLWDRDRLLFEQNETSRLAQLNEVVKKKGGPFSSLVGVGSVIAAFLVGGAHGVGYGFGTFFLGMFVVGMIMSVEEHFYRWRHAGLFVRREFAEPQPIYQQQAEPPRRTETRQETPPNEPAIVTSMRQAYEILGLPPGRITLDAVRTVYRTRMMEYHPDRVAHLGPELRKLAERKAKQFNLAMEFIEREAK